MEIPRRKFLQWTAGTAALPAVSRVAHADDYPNRPVRLIVGFPAGGSASDIVARLMAQWLSEHLGQQFVVENRPGAGTNIATEMVVRAAPDGYTLLLVSAQSAFNATLYDNLNFNFIRDIAPIAGTIRVPFVLVVNPSVPARSLPEFVAYAKANPGKINMASNGVGSAGHVAGALFNMMAGVNLVHVPYRSNFYPDLMSGQVQATFAPVPPVIGFVRGDKVRALAVTTDVRQEVLPDVPTVAEFVPGYEASGWQGLGAPKGTPDAIVDLLNRQINAALADPKIKAQLVDLGGTELPFSPSSFGKLIADETQKWGKVIRAAGIKAE